MSYTPTWQDNLPDAELDVYEPNLELFFKTMFERQEIWHKRFILGQERPWTTNKIFKNSKFTNVFRELDRHSQWQINNVFLPHKKENGRLDLIWKIMLFRFFNKPEFFDWIGKRKGKTFEGKMPSYGEYAQYELETLMAEYRAEGENPFTNAYLINSMACPGKKRDWCYANKVIPELHENVRNLNLILVKAKTPEDIIQKLKTLPAVADFIAHEFYQDFTYAPRYSGIQLMRFDQDDFTNVGPGASVGLRLIFPSLKNGKSQEIGIHWLRDLANEELKKLGDFKYLGWDSDSSSYFIEKDGNITLHQVEMWLCEFQKYWKMTIGKGKQRSEFVPKTLANEIPKRKNSMEQSS